LYAGHDALLCLCVFLHDLFFLASGEFAPEFLEEGDFGVACALPAEFFLAPFRYVLESSFGSDDNLEHAFGDHE